MTRKLFLCAAVALTSFCSTVFANEDIATPFGIKIGSPGSCIALDERLRALDPSIRRGPSEPDRVPSTSSYRPMGKAFPGAKGNMLVMCVEDRLQSIFLSVEKGASNLILWDVVSQLESKYQSLYDSESLGPTLRNGGRISYSAGPSYVTVDVPGDRNSFVLSYEYIAPLSGEAIDATRKQKEEAQRRKTAL